jgi:hypothetical protein
MLRLRCRAGGRERWSVRKRETPSCECFDSSYYKWVFYWKSFVHSLDLPRDLNRSRKKKRGKYRFQSKKRKSKQHAIIRFLLLHVNVIVIVVKCAAFCLCSKLQILCNLNGFSTVFLTCFMTVEFTSCQPNDHHQFRPSSNSFFLPFQSSQGIEPLPNQSILHRLPTKTSSL